MATVIPMSDAGAAKVNAQKKTETALQDLKSKQRDCETKLTDLQRRIDDTTNEVKALLQKGQREKAKLVLRRKNMLEKQVTSVQNVRSTLVAAALRHKTFQMLWPKAIQAAPCHLSIQGSRSLLCPPNWHLDVPQVPVLGIVPASDTYSNQWHHPATITCSHELRAAASCLSCAVSDAPFTRRDFVNPESPTQLVVDMH